MRNIDSSVVLWQKCYPIGGWRRVEGAMYDNISVITCPQYTARGNEESEITFQQKTYIYEIETWNN